MLTHNTRSAAKRMNIYGRLENKTINSSTISFLIFFNGKNLFSNKLLHRIPRIKSESLLTWNLRTSNFIAIMILKFHVGFPRITDCYRGGQNCFGFLLNSFNWITHCQDYIGLHWELRNRLVFTVLMLLKLLCIILYGLL